MTVGHQGGTWQAELREALAQLLDSHVVSAVRRFHQSLSFDQVLVDLRVLHALCGVHVDSETLQSDPLHRQLGDRALSVVISAVDLIGEAEVCDTCPHSA